jgi:hypothetical protein
MSMMWNCVQKILTTISMFLKLGINFTYLHKYAMALTTEQLVNNLLIILSTYGAVNTRIVLLNFYASYDRD